MDCGTCTVCCTLTIVKELEKLAGDVCEYCDSGCTIYNKRPDPCREFKCAYLQASKASIALRPDRSGIMFEKITDDIVIGILDPKGHNEFILQGQVSSFMKEGLNVITNHRGIPTVYHQDKVNPTDLLEILYKIAGKL